MANDYSIFDADHAATELARQAVIAEFGDDAWGRVVYRDGKLLVPQDLTATVDAVDLDDAAARATVFDPAIIGAAEREIDRLGDLLSVSSSRAARYEKKLEEALAYDAAGRPASVSEVDYPILVPEAAARGITKSELTDLILARAAAYNALMGHAEAIRASLPAAIAGAETLSEKQAAVDTLIAPFRAAIWAAVTV